MPPLPPAKYLQMMSQLTLGQGKWAGRKLDPLPYQVDLVQDIFELDENGNRKIREAMLFMPRKCAKTTTLASLVPGLLLEEPGGQVIGVAGTRDQASILLDIVKGFIHSSSIGGVPLTEWFDVRRYEIRCPERDSVYKVVASDGKTQHGLNPHAVIMDELHSWAPTRAEELYWSMSTAVGARENPLILGISTPGEIPSGFWFDMYTKARQHQLGNGDDERFLGRVYQADPDGDWSDPGQWEKATPEGAWGELVTEEFLARQYQTMPRYSFARLHLCVPTTASESWIAWEDWEQCSKAPDIPDGAKVFVGLDAAISRDTFGVSMVWLGPDDEYHVKSRRYTAAGGYIDPKEIETTILGWAQQYTIVKCGYDPAFMGLLAAQLSDHGIEMEPFPQTGSAMSRAAEVFQHAVRSGKIRHGGDKELSSQLANVGIRRSDRGVRISKGKSGGPIDMIVATAMAMDLATMARGNPEDMPVLLIV